MEIKERLISMLGGVSREVHRSEMVAFVAQQEALLQEVVEKHDMQGAWEQIKQERKLRRYH